MEDAMRKGRCSHPRDGTSLPERWGYEFKGKHPQNLIHHETVEHPLSSDSKTMREADFCAMQDREKSQSLSQARRKWPHLCSPTANRE